MTIAETLVKEVVSHTSVHSDQGRNFESSLLSEICRLLGVKMTCTTPLQPKSDDMVKRFNITLKAELSEFVDLNQRDWYEHVPLLMMAYQTVVHNTTGEPPAMTMMGRSLRLPISQFIGLPMEKGPLHKSE